MKFPFCGFLSQKITIAWEEVAVLLLLMSPGTSKLFIYWSIDRPSNCGSLQAFCYISVTLLLRKKKSFWSWKVFSSTPLFLLRHTWSGIALKEFVERTSERSSLGYVRLFNRLQFAVIGWILKRLRRSCRNIWSPAWQQESKNFALSVF